jgi:hypothetical protein
MKAISLVFEYDFKKQKKSGRMWGEKGYRSKDFIFEYSAASFATFAHHNKSFNHEIMTDDKDLLWKNMSKYDVDFSCASLIDAKDRILDWKNHRYCFYPAMMHLDMYKEEEDYLLKLDNDLECKKPIDELVNKDQFLLWKHERNVSKGRQYWGESVASQRAFGTSNFETYNIGVLGFPKGEKKEIIDEMIQAGLKMSEMDISDVVRFPDSPGDTASMWSCSEQTGYCYILHTRGENIVTVEDYIDHHCYGIESKSRCIDNSKFLLK